MDKESLLKEYIKCLNDISYYAEKYCVVYDQTQKSFVPAKVFPKQKGLLEHYQANRFSIVLKPRQSGVSTITALYCAHLILFATERSPIRVLIIANKRDTAIEFLKKIKGYIETAPAWLGVEFQEGSNNKAEFTCTNGSGAKAVGTSPDALRGYTPNVLVLDEAAFIEGADELWTASAASLSTGGRAIFVSTPNSRDPLYYKTYDESLKGNNDFKPYSFFWYEDPRFNKDLTLEKEIIEDWTDEEGKEHREVRLDSIIPKRSKVKDDWDYEYIKEMMTKGYEPTSEWFRGMCASYNGDERKIAQELKTVFSGSGDNVIADKYVDVQEKYCKEPIRTGFFDNNLHIWEEPIEGNEYLLASDVSSGSSDDFSSIEIWNITTGEQAAEWVGKISPDILGEMINDIGLVYDAYVIVDITGGYGTSTIIKLQELEYPHIHYSDSSKVTDALKMKFNSNFNDNKIPGFIIGGNRTNMISRLEQAVRKNEIKVKSKRLINEFRSFIYRNGRPDHVRGGHDDLIMALAMLLYVHQYAFKNVKKFKKQTENMLNSITMSSNSRSTYQSGYGKTSNGYNDDFSWLFR